MGQTAVDIDITIAESSLPWWMPPEGSYGLVPMQNAFSAIEPEVPDDPPEGITGTWGAVFEAHLNHFNGAAFAPDYSEYGAFVVGGGGGGVHDSWNGTNVSVADLTTLLWNTILEPSVYALNEGNNEQFDRVDPNWRDFPDHHPLIAHSYTAPQVWPASFGVSGSKGLFLVSSVLHSDNKIFWHSVDLANPSTWQRLGDRYFDFVGLGYAPAACTDTYRQCSYAATGRNGGTNVHYKIDKNGIHTQHTGGLPVLGTYSCMNYIPPPYDCIIGLGRGDQVNPQFVVINPDADGNGNWSAHFPSFTGSRPNFNGSRGQHLEWCPTRGYMFCFDPATGIGYILRPPVGGSVFTGTWTWEQEQLSVHDPLGTMVNYGADTAGQWNKVRYAPALKAFIHAYHGVDMPSGVDVQLRVIRPLGA